ncbi:MAG: PQQ-dependent sugar dehydrogenase [Longimicrobiales bacterium]
MQKCVRNLGLVAASLMVIVAPLHAQRGQCAPDNGGISLPAGFCATVFADSLPGPRHLRVHANGDVYVSLLGRGGRTGAAAVPGGVIILRDANRDGKADTQLDVVRGVAMYEVILFDNHIYVDRGMSVVRYPIKAGVAAPTGPGDTIVSGLPPGGHSSKTFTIGPDGSLYVNIGSATNSCAIRGDAKHGTDPCIELATRAGIWRFDARKPGQKQSDGVRFVSGVRNAIGMTIGPDNDVWAMQHGRDGLQSFPEYFDSKYGAENPGEELMHMKRSDDYGWPYCYYSTFENKLVDAPEYGGDGKKTDRCASKTAPVAAYPGHWAPNDLVFYTGTSFPAKYRGGVFIAFHGSWNRAPEPQAGYKVVFQPMRDGKPSGAYETFADRFSPNSGGAGPNRRPGGLAVGRDGALYIADDATGRIWKVTYNGRRN